MKNYVQVPELLINPETQICACSLPMAGCLTRHERPAKTLHFAIPSLPLRFTAAAASAETFIWSFSYEARKLQPDNESTSAQALISPDPIGTP